MINWIFNLLVFLFPAIMFPLYWLRREVADFINAWYYVNILADVMPFYYLVFLIMNIVIASYSGRGDRQICDSFDFCVFNDNYNGTGDALANLFVWLVLDAASYFVLLWFGGDAVRYLVPKGNFEMKHLYPQFLYKIFVMTDVAPNHQHHISFDHIPQAIEDEKARREQAKVDRANGKKPNNDDDASVEIDITVPDVVITVDDEGFEITTEDDEADATVEGDNFLASLFTI